MRHASMRPAKQPEPAILSLLLIWASHRLARFIASLKPAHDASRIAALVACDGNPPGG